VSSRFWAILASVAGVMCAAGLLLMLAAPAMSSAPGGIVLHTGRLDAQLPADPGNATLPSIEGSISSAPQIIDFIGPLLPR